MYDDMYIIYAHVMYDIHIINIFINSKHLFFLLTTLGTIKTI